MRIAVDLDGTLIGAPPSDGGIRKSMLRSDLVQILSDFKRRGHTIILWTFGNRLWWQRVSDAFPILRSLFDKVYTRDEMPGRVTAVHEMFRAVKDIRLIDADVLIDNDSSHYDWAKEHGLESRYILIKTFGRA
jgi:hypothetical protein